MRIMIKPRDTFDMDGFVLWATYKQKWCPISHVYVGRADEVPPAGDPFKTKEDSDLKRRLYDLWRLGKTVVVKGYYDNKSERLIVTEIVKAV